MRCLLALVAILFSTGCQPADSGDGSSTTADPVRASPTGAVQEVEAASWIGKAWMQTDSAERPGVLRVFLADGTLLMDSCWETYRLARWESTSDSTVVWREDTAEIEAHLEPVGSDELRVRLQLVGEVVEEVYREAEVPYTCPDMVR